MNKKMAVLLALTGSLSLFAMEADEEAIQEKEEAVQAFLEAHGFQGINTQSAFGEYPLHRAIREVGLAEPTIVYYLIESGAEVNQKERSGMTPLMAAAERGQYGIAKRLIENGANPFAWDNAGNDVSFWAETGGDPYVIELIDENTRN